jgi:hypothetical protein
LLFLTDMNMAGCRSSPQVVLFQTINNFYQTCNPKA